MNPFHTYQHSYGGTSDRKPEEKQCNYVRTSAIENVTPSISNNSDLVPNKRALQPTSL